MLCWTRIDWSMKMREISRGVDKKLHANNDQNKGVISEIRNNDEEYPPVIVVDDDKMPIIKSGPFKGLRAEVCLNPLGVINRINVSQLFEHEFNFISMYIKLKIKEANTKEEKEKWYFEYIKDINEDQYEFTKNWYDKLTNEKQMEYLKECEENIYIHQEPFYNNTNFDLLTKLYDKYDFIKPFEFEGINIPLIMGEMYFLRLKHDWFKRAKNWVVYKPL